MTDEVTPQTQPSAPKKDEKGGEKKQGPGGGQGGNKGSKRNMSRSGSTSGGPQRPSSGAGNRRNASNPPANDSGAESKKGDNAGGKKPDPQRPKSQGNGNPRGGGNRKPSQGGRHNNRESVSRQSSGRQASGSPANVPAPPTDGNSDALLSLQRVIADLKTASPSTQPINMNNPLGGPVPVPIPTSQSTSNLPPNAPIFQPGAAAFPGPMGNEPPRHRKAASLGAGSLPGNFNSFSPNLGSMMEDVIEEGPGGTSFEEGEIQETVAPAAGHQRRSLSQSFTAPRFAALAAQQEQADAVGVSGRPQLAPNFMFGARRRPSAAMPMGPPINEEDVGFQFPQQQHAQPNFNMEHPVESNAHRRTESSGEISGIMAEQVREIGTANLRSILIPVM